MTSDALLHDSIRVGGRRILLAPHNCFACGTLNAHGLHLDLHVGDGHCWTDLLLEDRFEGWEGIVHGGILCTILDEVMTWTLVSHDLWAATARMTVDFKRPVRVGHRIHAEGRVREVHRRLITAEGRIEDAGDGTLLVGASGTYVGASEARKAELKARYAFRLEPDGADDAEPRWRPSEELELERHPADRPGQADGR